MAEAINKMYEKMSQVSKSMEEKIKPVEEALFDPEQGMMVKINQVGDGIDSTNKNLQTMMEENVQLRDEVEILKGIVHKLSNQLEITNSKVAQLVANSMEDNLIFTGILEDLPKRNPRNQLHQFFNEELGITDIRDRDLLKVYRIGQPEKGWNRPIIAFCTTELRRYILSQAPLLKNRTNAQGANFYINQQLPEAISEQKREIRQIIKDRKDKEQNLPQPSKSAFVVRNDKVFINGQLQRKKITPPKVKDLFIEESEQEKVDAIKMRYYHTPPEKGSQFKVAILKTDNFNQVKYAYTRLFQNQPSADHIAVAAMIKGEEAYHDNGEFGAGYRMLRSIKKRGDQNVAVFLIRYYGGVNLGPRRFKIIADLVDASLEKLSVPRHSMDSSKENEDPPTDVHQDGTPHDELDAEKEVEQE